MGKYFQYVGPRILRIRAVATKSFIDVNGLSLKYYFLNRFEERFKKGTRLSCIQALLYKLFDVKFPLMRSLKLLKS